MPLEFLELALVRLGVVNKEVRFYVTLMFMNVIETWALLLW